VRLSECDLPRTFAIRHCKPFGSRGKKIINIAARNFEKPVFDLVLICGVSIIQNVRHINSAMRQRATYKQASVTVQGVSLRTHESDAIFRCTLKNAVDSFAEISGLSHLLVVRHTFTVKPAFAWSPTQLLPKKDV